MTRKKVVDNGEGLGEREGNGLGAHQKQMHRSYFSCYELGCLLAPSICFTPPPVSTIKAKRTSSKPKKQCFVILCFWRVKQRRI